MTNLRLGVVRGISYGLFGPPDPFVEAARGLGASLVRCYVYWSQVEPSPGQYRWDVVDALLAQVEDGQTEVWVTVCSSSPWATRTPTDFLPPSPAHDVSIYGEFVRRLVERCSGRVAYWQCDNEPTNTALLWAGTAAEYVTQLSTMYGAVQRADPSAQVVLGGCGYDALTGEPARALFREIVEGGWDYFDLFAVNLYGDPTRVPDYLATARELMAGLGGAKPIVVGEHGGPLVFEFPEVDATLQAVMAEAFAAPPAAQSTADLRERETAGTPERRAMTALYDRMADLPPRLAMFLEGCPAELEAKRDRINCRQLVMRTMLALAEGVHRMAYWNLALEVPAAVDPRQLMHLMFGKLRLLDYDEQAALTVRRPAADTFALLARELAGARTVQRVIRPERPSLYAFDVERDEGGPLLVLWERRDPFDGEVQPPDPVAWPWPAPTAFAVDAFGLTHAVDVHHDEVRLSLADTPIFLVGRP